MRFSLLPPHLLATGVMHWELDSRYHDRELGLEGTYRVHRVALGVVLMYGAGLISAFRGSVLASSIRTASRRLTYRANAIDPIVLPHWLINPAHVLPARPTFRSRIPGPHLRCLAAYAATFARFPHICILHHRRVPFLLAS